MSISTRHSWCNCQFALKELLAKNKKRQCFKGCTRAGSSIWFQLRFLNKFWKMDSIEIWPKRRDCVQNQIWPKSFEQWNWGKNSTPDEEWPNAFLYYELLAATCNWCRLMSVGRKNLRFAPYLYCLNRALNSGAELFETLEALSIINFCRQKCVIHFCRQKNVHRHSSFEDRNVSTCQLNAVNCNVIVCKGECWQSRGSCKPLPSKIYEAGRREWGNKTNKISWKCGLVDRIPIGLETDWSGQISHTCYSQESQRGAQMKGCCLRVVWPSVT